MSDGVHTVPNPHGPGWVNKVHGEVATPPSATKTQAVEEGRAIARQQKLEHTIHKETGVIGAKNSYGNDPNPPTDGNGRRERRDG